MTHIYLVAALPLTDNQASSSNPKDSRTVCHTPDETDRLSDLCRSTPTIVKHVPTGTEVAFSFECSLVGHLLNRKPPVSQARVIPGPSSQPFVNWGDQESPLRLLCPHQREMQLSNRDTKDWWHQGAHINSELKPNKNIQSLIFKQKKIKTRSVFLKYLMAQNIKQ